jgi:hypothetical protein
LRSFLIQTSDQRDRLIQFITGRELPIQVDVGEPREPRTTSQNSRLWALHTLASGITGYSPDEMHNVMLAKFFGTKEVEVNGFRFTVPAKRSSARDKKEFRQFLEDVENYYASELGVWLGQEETELRTA